MREFAVTPPHPKPSLRSGSDLSPQAGRGKKCPLHYPVFRASSATATAVRISATENGLAMTS